MTDKQALTSASSILFTKRSKQEIGLRKWRLVDLYALTDNDGTYQSPEMSANAV